MKKFIALFIIACSLFGISFAQGLEWFVVNINPSTVKVWEPADLTVKAVDSNGDILTDYQGDIIITVLDEDGNELDIADYTAPNDGTYTFTEEDQWEKIFTKWLIINKSGKFKVKVEDFDTSKSWIVSMNVISSTSWLEGQKIKISSPKNNEIVTKGFLTVIWDAKNYKNSKVEILVDWKVVGEWIVWNDGTFQVVITDLKNKEYKLVAQIKDIDNKIVSKSDEVVFKIQVVENLFKRIEILPSSEVTQWTKVTINVYVDPKVDTATLKISNYGEFPMERASTTSFTTQFVVNTPGKFDINLALSSEDKTKDYNNVAQIVVLEKIAIWEVKFNRDNIKNNIELNWKFTWQVPRFKVKYGTQKDNLSYSGIVSENKFKIENIDPALTYYVIISPVDTNGNIIWDPSKLIVIESNMQKAATCKVDNIKVDIVRKNNDNYLVWSKVEGANKYLVYQWTEKDKLTVTATVTWTEYKLPFNPNAKKITYSYFAVKASCDDGNLKQIDDIKKVKTWPLDWLIYAFIITIIVYWLKLSLVKD